MANRPPVKSRQRQDGSSPVEVVALVDAPVEAVGVDPVVGCAVVGERQEGELGLLRVLAPRVLLRQGLHGSERRRESGVVN